MTRNQVSAAKAKGTRMREQAGAKSARVREQAGAKSARAREQATARGMRLREEAGVKRARAREQAIRSRGQARRTAARITPVAIGIGITARRGLRSARLWAAPRVEQAGRSVEKDVAPKVAAMLSAAAHRIEPPSRKRSIRWPLLGAGAAAVAGGGAIAAFVMSRKGMATPGGHGAETATPVPVSAPASGPAGESSQAGAGSRSQPS